jgi:hypothetical protein
VKLSPAAYPIPDPLAKVFQPVNAEFLLVKPVPLGNVIVAPVVSDIPVIEPVPPFALNETSGFGFIGVVYLTITTPDPPAVPL